METKKEKTIECKLKDDKWICKLNDKEKEVSEILTDHFALFSDHVTIFPRTEMECHLTQTIIGQRELMCLKPEDFEHMKELILKEE